MRKRARGVEKDLTNTYGAGSRSVAGGGFRHIDGVADRRERHPARRGGVHIVLVVYSITFC